MFDLIPKVATGTVAAAFAVLGFAAAAHAHDQLIAHSPAANEVVAEAPTEITLEFNNSILDVGTVIEVQDASGVNIAVGEPVLAGPQVTMALPEDLAEGAYRVLWRVVSSDGHPIAGTFNWAYGADGEAALAELESAQQASQDATETPESEAAEDSSETATQEAPSQNPGEADSGETAADSEGQSNTAKVLFGSAAALVGVAIVIAVVMWFMRRDRADGADSQDAPDQA